MFQGSIVALVTPMHLNGTIITQELTNLIKWHIDSNTTAILIGGSTGEKSSLQAQELYDLIEHSVQVAQHHLPIIANVGCNSATQTIKNITKAAQLGAQAVLVITPNNANQEELCCYYSDIANHSQLPIILYNVPSRTKCNLLPATVHQIVATCRNIIGIKEASGDLAQVKAIIAVCPKNFAVYSGSDEHNLAIMHSGGIGTISVTANIVPEKMHMITQAMLDKDFQLAAAIDQQLLPLHKALFVELNPIPVKWALHQMGLISPGIRPPLRELAINYHEQMRKALNQSGVYI